MRYVSEKEKKDLLVEVKKKVFEIQALLPEGTDISYLSLSVGRDRIHINAYDNAVNVGSIASSWYDESNVEWREFCGVDSDGWHDDYGEF